MKSHLLTLKRTAIYLLAGTLMDGLVTWYYVSVGSRDLFLASVLSSLITLFSMFVINGILTNDDPKSRPLLIVAYAIGNGIGTASVMALR
jgi:putative flippase GtrA